MAVNILLLLLHFEIDFCNVDEAVLLTIIGFILCRFQMIVGYFPDVKVSEI